MKKLLKKIFVFLVVLIFLSVLFLAAWVFWIFPNFVSPKSEFTQEEPGASSVAQASEKIDLNESNGVLYVNNEIIVFIEPSASQEEITALFKPLGAQIDDSMADIDVYRLVFSEAMSYDALEDLIRKIKKNPIVEDAYLNPVTEFAADEIELEKAAGPEQADEPEDDFAYQDPAYPDDPWNSAAWNVSVPDGENWGMEAIDAPGAWGYRDRFGTVKIGLIDSMPDLSHEDLTVAGSSCLFIDESTGITSVNKYNLSAGNHGTHVAGIMNAAWDNAAGVSGVMAGKGELYYSAVYYESNGKITERYATAYSYLLALKTLIDQDVQVINISQNTRRLVGFAASRGNGNAINYLSLQADLAQRGLARIIAARQAENKPDFLICVAAGNSNTIYYYPDDKALYGYREKMTFWERLKYLFGWRGEVGGSLAQYNNFLNLMDDPAVESRVVVVGAVGIDGSESTSNHTQYAYTDYSNVGSRVDLVAPGDEIYSCIPGGYAALSGTSMATPHVSGTAGLIFACNPALSGAEVKDLLLASTTGRYYYGDDYSGLLNANLSVVNALKTLEAPVEKVLQTQVNSGMDLCFVVDTTGSMGDDIDNAKENMASILEHIAAKTEDYRVALIDYRDFPSRTYHSNDYPYQVQLTFTDDNDAILGAINGLDLGSGGDDEETVYSALMSAVELDWRNNAKKVIIIMGDAAPLDPEPTTGYTYDDVLLALFNADISIDYEDSDERVVSALDTSLINVFSIGTNASSDAADFFEKISESTGGSYAGVDNASEVSDAIIDSIEQIEVVQKFTVYADFGDEMAHQKINLYAETEYLFTVETDGNGRVRLENMEADTYRWTSSGLYEGGSVEIDADQRNADVRMTREYWFTPLLKTCHRHMRSICLALAGYLVLCIAIPLILRMICRKVQKRKALRPAAGAAPAVDRAAPAVDRAASAVGKAVCAADKAVSAADRAASVVGRAAPAVDKAVPAVSVAVQDHDDSKYCPKCGAKTAHGAKFCKQCGCSLQPGMVEQTETVCPNCGSVCDHNEKYCGKCGAKIEGR